MKGGSKLARANMHMALATESCIFLSFNRISFIQAQGNRSYDYFQHFYLQYNKICFQPFESKVSPKQGLVSFKSFISIFLEKVTCEIKRWFFLAFAFKVKSLGHIPYADFLSSLFMHIRCCC